MQTKALRLLKQVLTWELWLCGILSVIVPAVVYVAAPVYIQMGKLPQSEIAGMRLLGFEFALYVLIKLILNWKAKTLKRPWLAAAVLWCAPTLWYISGMWANSELALESVVGMLIYTFLIAGPSIYIASVGGYFVIKPQGLPGKN